MYERTVLRIFPLRPKYRPIQLLPANTNTHSKYESYKHNISFRPIYIMFCLSTYSFVDNQTLYLLTVQRSFIVHT